ncbi:MAG: terminase large subunit domain-containing protein [Acidimicrobiales bacterium]
MTLASSTAEKVRVRWGLKARDTQLPPKAHHLCADQSGRRCRKHIEAATRKFGAVKARHLLDDEALNRLDERDAWLAERGHVDWWIWLLLAGRGWGKTRVGAEATLRFMLDNPGCRVALVAATFQDGRDTMVEGDSGIRGLVPFTLIRDWNRSLGELILANGSRAKVFSAEEPERLRGPQHHWAWCDELAAWKYLQRTWDMLLFGLRLGENPRVVITTTPKAYRFIRNMVSDSRERREGIVVTTGRTDENRANLSRHVLRKLHEAYDDTRLGRQELDAEILDELGAGVIRLEDIERTRLQRGAVQAAIDFADVPDRELHGLFRRIVIAVDPAVTSDPKTSDETGIVVVAKTHKPCPFCTVSDNPHRKAHAVVLADHSGIMSDAAWCGLVAALYKRWHADSVVAEVNNGGDLVESVIHAVEAQLPVRKVRASRGKVQRAEPVGACYERGEVHHYQTEASHSYSTLEDQLTRLGADLEEDEGYREGTGGETPSPDRADAAVWGLSDLMVPEVAATTVSTVADQRGSRSRRDPTLTKAREVLAKAGIPGRRPDLSRNGRRSRSRR